MRPSSPAAITLMATAALLSAGCLSTSVMDTAQSLPAGDRAVTSGFAGGLTNGNTLSYGHPGSPDSTHDAYPGYEYALEWMTRYSYGLGNGLQADLELTAPMPILGIGLGFQLKWELPLRRRERFALALTAGGGANFGGYGGGGQSIFVGMAGTDAGLIASFHAGRHFAIYAAPRARMDVVYHRQNIGSDPASATARGISYSGALGIMRGQADQKDRFLEVVFLHSPQTLPEMDHGWRIMLGVGLRSQELTDFLPW